MVIIVLDLEEDHFFQVRATNCAGESDNTSLLIGELMKIVRMILLHSFYSFLCSPSFEFPTCWTSLPAGLLLLSVRRDVLLFQCGLGYTPREVVTAACEQGGVWSPNPINYTCDLSVPTIGM